MQIPPLALRLVTASAALVTTLVLSTPVADARRPAPRRVVLVTLDGARLEEVFGGLDEGVARQFARDRGLRLSDWPAYSSLAAPTAKERRTRLMPFLWGTLLREHGSIAGNRALGSVVRVRNRHGYSYPGYSEMLTGMTHDDLVSSNDEQPSPTRTVLEATRLGLSLRRDEVALFGSWNRLRCIAERKPGTIHVDAGPATASSGPFPDLRSDEQTVERALAHMRSASPRFVHVALGETDEWAHVGRYDLVLDAYRKADEALRRIWELVEGHPAFLGRTLLIVTTDHGRGRNPSSWRHHGPGIAGTEDVFMAIASPNSPHRGEWSSVETLELGQVAPTIAAWLEVPGVAGPLAPVDVALAPQPRLASR